MAGYVILGALAAFGLLSILWAAMGWLLPGGRGMALVCVGEPDAGILARYRWLRSLGLMACPLIVVAEDAAPVPSDGVEICEPGNLLSRLELERVKIDGTGNGDPPGRHQRSGVSEL